MYPPSRTIMDYTLKRVKGIPEVSASYKVF
jgi:hypothetical protein